MPYTRTELENYQWYQDKIKARRDEYNSYLKEVETDQVDNEPVLNVESSYSTSNFGG